MKDKSQSPKAQDQKDCPMCQAIMPGDYRCRRCLSLMYLEAVYERNEARAEIEKLKNKFRTELDYYEKLDKEGYPKLIDENKRLEAQVAEMREALKRMRWVSGLHQG